MISVTGGRRAEGRHSFTFLLFNRNLGRQLLLEGDGFLRERGTPWKVTEDTKEQGSG